MTNYKKKDVNAENKIDFVIAWVDGNDKAWQAKMAEYGHGKNEQFRDWNFLPYLLKSIDRYAPFVHRIFLVTDRQNPDCLSDAGREKYCLSDDLVRKIKVIYHEEFIPQKYLPTFNSHTIELNFHRIPGLSEQFVYFNDDVLLTGPCAPEDFFRDGLPVDCGCLNAINGKDPVFAGIQFHNMVLMNGHYDIGAVRAHLWKWLNPIYGRQNIRTLLLLPFQRLQGIYNPHGPLALKKNTYEKLWKRDGDILDQTCLCKFRKESNVSVYVMRYEQLLSGNFVPGKINNRYLEVTYPLKRIAAALDRSGSVCINDTDMDDMMYLKRKKQIQYLLKEKYCKN